MAALVAGKAALVTHHAPVMRRFDSASLPQPAIWQK
jgi:hypothetical protein